MQLVCTVLLILSLASTSFAQGRPVGDAPPRLIISDRAVAMGIAATPPARVQPSRDSLWNGAIIGALVGGIAMGSVVGWICRTLKEPGDPSCWQSVMYGAALGAGAGAAGGAGVDALLARPHQRLDVRRFSNQ